MLRAKLINKANGVGKDSGKPWCRITLASDKMDGTRAVGDFWCNQIVSAKVANISIDTLVYVTTELDESLHFNIVDIRTADVTK